MYELIPLPGNTYDMVGFRAFGDVVYLADCLSGRETTEKYRVNFLVNVGDYLATLAKVKAMEAACFIPAHAKATDDIAELASTTSTRSTPSPVTSAGSAGSPLASISC